MEFHHAEFYFNDKTVFLISGEKVTLQNFFRQGIPVQGFRYRTSVLMLAINLLLLWPAITQAATLDCLCNEGDPDEAVIAGNGSAIIGERISTDVNNILEGLIHRTMSSTLDREISPTDSRYDIYSISDDGGLVVFLSRDDSLVPSDSNGDAESVFLWRLATETLEILPVAGNGEQFPDDGDIRALAISGDGQYVIFHSYDYDEGFRRLRLSDGTIDTVPNSDGWLIEGFDVSDDGDVLVWDSGDDSAPGDENYSTDIYLYRFSDSTFDIVSNTYQGNESYYGGYSGSVTGDGQFVYFMSEDEDIIPSDPTYWEDVYRYSTSTGQAIQVLGSQIPDTRDDRPYGIHVSDDGEWLFFLTVAQLVDTDNDAREDIYAMRPEASSGFQLLSVQQNGDNGPEPVSSNSTRVQSVSQDGSLVSFIWPEVLVPGALPVSNYLLDRGDVLRPTISNLEFPDGQQFVLGSPFEVTALASDQDSGNSQIVRAEFSIDQSAWQPMNALDGAFDSAVELVQVFVDTSVLVIGGHTLCVRAVDSGGSPSNRACDSFEVIPAPPEVDFMLECRHFELWPQAGDSVAISAAAWVIDSEGLADGGYPVDRIEVWYEENGAPVSIDDTEGTTSNVYYTPNLTEGTRTYGCRAVIGEVAVFSGWKTFTVGLPEGDGAIPVSYSASPANAVDVVFVPDVDSYSGVEDPDFAQDVFEMIRDGFHRYDLYNRFQHRFNFWLSRNTGRVDRESDEGDSPRTLEKPTDWKENYSFADVAAIVHTDSFRGFARSGGFAAQTGSPRTARHEAAHSPFGLSDEYCCDTGYYERDHLPNVYETLASCEADTLNLGREPGDCRSWVSERNDETYYTSEPDEPELMRGGNKANAADIRRIEWMFNRCSLGEC